MCRVAALMNKLELVVAALLQNHPPLLNDNVLVSIYLYLSRLLNVSKDQIQQNFQKGIQEGLLVKTM